VNLNKFIKIGKNVLNREDHCNIIYRVNYLECDASYVRQTKESLKHA